MCSALQSWKDATLICTASGVFPPKISTLLLETGPDLQLRYNLTGEQPWGDRHRTDVRNSACGPYVVTLSVTTYNFRYINYAYLPRCSLQDHKSESLRQGTQ